MPPPRRSPQRSKYRRSRSRSYSPRHRRSRSHSRNRKRSRSHERHRSRSRDRLRSRSRDRRRSRSREPRRSRSPYRKRSESPVVLRAEERGFPVKRPADSSNKRLAHRSPSPSPPPRHKKLRDEPSGRRLGMRAPSPYSGKAESQKPSTSRAPLFPAASTKRTEIDFVVITDKRPKEKLNKRFQAVDQGRFDFDENITIGIHRGPGHIHLDHDEDIEVNYAFNPKSFKMLFPKKDYVKNIFDRDEILVFQHDAVLDEEAYVEKRTISVQPVERSRSRHAHDDLDYKITVGGDRSLSGDRRRVQDSGFRSGDYDRNIPVTVRLDPKPDPRYERLYKAQQRHEEGPELGASGQRSPHRSPHDLRYNLNRRKTDDGRHSDVLDARTRIVARRQDSFDDDVPSAMRDSKRPMGRTDLPDFKNRPDDRSDEQPAQRWGFCKICNVPLHSESEANDHVNGIQHQSNEAALDQGELHEMPDHSFRGANPRGRGRGRGRGGARGGWAGRGRWRPAVDTDKHDKRPTDGNKFQVEPWKVNPTDTPKGDKYYQHDNRSRDDMNFWERKQMYLETGKYPGRGYRGRGFRGRGRGFVPRGRGFVPRGRGFVPRGRGFQSPYKRGFEMRHTASMDEWKHDKFDQDDGDGEETMPVDKQTTPIKTHDAKRKTEKIKTSKSSRKKDSSEEVSSTQQKSWDDVEKDEEATVS